jgi:hypothetical protein
MLLNILENVKLRLCFKHRQSKKDLESKPENTSSVTEYKWWWDSSSGPFAFEEKSTL